MYCIDGIHSAAHDSSEYAQICLGVYLGATADTLSAAFNSISPGHHISVHSRQMD